MSRARRHTMERISLGIDLPRREFLAGAGAAGVEVNLAAMVGGAEIQPALASGAINIGWTNVISMGQGHAQGFDFRFVANGAINKRGTNDVFGFLVRQDSPIKSAK